MPTLVKSDKIWVMTLTLLVQAVNTWAMLVIASIAPTVAEGVGVAVVLVGYQISLVYTLASLISLRAGWLLDRIGPTRTMQISLLAVGLGAALAASGGLWGLITASVAIGIGYGLVNPATSELLYRRTTARDRSLVFSIKQTGVPLGGMIAGSLTPLLALALGWQGAVLAVGPAALALAVAIEPGRRRRDGPRPARLPGSRRGQDGGMARVLGDPGLRNLCAMAFLFAATQLSLAGFVVAFGVLELGFSPIAAGLLLSLVQFSGGSARLLLGWIADRLQANAQVLAATGGLAALGGIGFFAIGLTGQATPAWIVYALAILFGIGAVGWNGIFLAEVANRAPPDLVGAVTGAANVITFAGVVFGPIIFVALHGVFDSYAAAFLAMALPAGLGSVLVARIRRG